MSVRDTSLIGAGAGAALALHNLALGDFVTATILAVGALFFFWDAWDRRDCSRPR